MKKRPENLGNMGVFARFCENGADKDSDFLEGDREGGGDNPLLNIYIFIQYQAKHYNE